jgi:hypothetical protein
MKGGTIVLLILFLGLLPIKTYSSTLSENSEPSEGIHQPHSDGKLIARRRFAVNAAGLQWLGMSNHGELSNPDHLSGHWIPELEYPGGTGTVFLFSGGIWVGAIKEGIPIVSTATDGDNGTGEYGPLEFATPEDMADIDVLSVGWLEKVPGPVSEDLIMQARLDGRYLGVGSRGVDDDDDWNIFDDLNGDGIPSADWDGPEGDANNDGIFDYDPEPGIDEDPSGDISADNIDNDHDGLFDAADPDLDGDAVPGDLDDDGDGLEDEDDSAISAQELITAYVDTCISCLQSPDIDGFTPLGIRVLQHSYQWTGSIDRDSILIEFEITNIGDGILEDICIGTFFDFDVGHLTQQGSERSEDDITRYLDDIQMAIGADNDGDNGLLDASEFGVRVEETPLPTVQATYKNFSRLAGADPEDNTAKYTLMSSGERDPDQWEPSDWRFVLAFGPLGDLDPGQTLPVTVAILNWPPGADATPATLPLYVDIGDVEPNPFSNQAHIEFTLSRRSHVEISIHDVIGRTVKVISSATRHQGTHDIVWFGRDSLGRNVSSGLYFMKIRTDEHTLCRPMVLVR